MLAHCRVFRHLWRDSFLCVAKEKGPKERPPYRVGLRRLCALQPRAGAAELAIAQTVLAQFRSKLAVLDNTKGVIKINNKVNTLVADESILLTPRNYSVMLV